MENDSHTILYYSDNFPPIKNPSSPAEGPAQRGSDWPNNIRLEVAEAAAGPRRRGHAGRPRWPKHPRHAVPSEPAANKCQQLIKTRGYWNQSG